MLTPKQAAFVAEYLIDLNASAAARRAGYSPKRAAQQALENLRKPDIAAAIQAAMQARSQRVQRSADDVVIDIGRVRESCMQTVTDPDTGLQVMLNPKDALKALELEGRHLGVFERDNAQSRPQVMLTGFRVVTS